MSGSIRKPCLKCLLRDMDRGEEYAKLKDYIERFDADIRVEDAVYERRLCLCRKCDCLADGICRKCGCYVEARALRKNGGCPHEHPRW